MKLFTADLYRNFAIGFAIGAAFVGVANAENWSDQVAPPAQAAQVLEAPQPTDDFWSL